MQCFVHTSTVYQASISQNKDPTDSRKSDKNFLQEHLPLVNTPHGLYYSQGWRGKLVEFLVACHSMSLSSQMIVTPHVSLPQAVLLPSFSLWHRRPVFGKWLPLALPFGKSSSQSQQISVLIHL